MTLPVVSSNSLLPFAAESSARLTSHSAPTVFRLRQHFAGELARNRRESVVVARAEWVPNQAPLPILCGTFDRPPCTRGRQTAWLPATIRFRCPTDHRL